MVYGVETVARENLESALASYEKKIPKIANMLHEITSFKAIRMLSDASKKLLNEELATIKADTIDEQFFDYNIKLDALDALTEKLERLKLKKAAVEAELAKRDVEGEPEYVHHTTYYIDYENGSDSNDGLGSGSGNAWQTLAQYTTNTVRSAGDICYVRGSQTHSYSSNIDFDEDGTPSSQIKILGDDGTIWSGDTDRPVIDFGSNSAYFNIDGDDYWYIERLDVSGSSASYGNFRVGGKDIEFKSCRFKNCTGGNYGVAFIYWGHNIVFEDCQWEGNSNYSMRLYDNEDVTLIDCTFDGNAGCILLSSHNSYVKMINVEFGGTTANTGNDVSVNSNSMCTVLGRNVTFNDTNKVYIGTTAFGSRILIEDYNGTKGDNRAWYGEGVIVKNTTTVRSGGADSSAEAEPETYCSIRHPLEILDIPIWCAAEETTITVYVYGTGWSVFPTSSELFLETLYWNTSSVERTEATSTQVLTANSTWTALSVTFTPYNAGLVYLRLKLAKYESGAKIYADIKPVVS